jgi:P27 family predicted phage terminase small subunit
VPQPTPKRPACPNWLNAEAKAEWRRIVPELERLNLLTTIDRAALATYCQTWARYVEAEAKIAQYGSVLKSGKSDYVQVSPYATISRQCSQIIKAFAAEFGLTPSSRSRITTYGTPTPGSRHRTSQPAQGDPRSYLRAVK